ncbi:hypothetical protein P9112_001001 [Eukaryota sp. TZLM1-RC]
MTTQTSSETTLDEPISATLGRDFKKIGYRLSQVLIPRLGTAQSEERYKCLRDWDLWFPLVVCFALSAILQRASGGDDDGGKAFSLVFLIVSVGSFVVSVNTTLLGGNASLFQSVSLLCYCLAPLALAAFISLFLQENTIIRFILAGVAVFWGTTASIGFFAGLVPSQRKVLATYPVWLFFVTIGLFVWASSLSTYS